MNIILSHSTGKPIYEQITSQIKAMVMSGELMSGEALPSMRLLAMNLRVSVITTKRAYEDLERDGFIETIVGKGSFIAKQNILAIREHHQKEIEAYFQKAISLAKSNSISCTELTALLQILYKEM